MGSEMWQQMNNIDLRILDGKKAKLLFATEAEAERTLSHGQLFTEPFLITTGSRWEVEEGGGMGGWGGGATDGAKWLSGAQPARFTNGAVRHAPRTGGLHLYCPDP